MKIKKIRLRGIISTDHEDEYYLKIGDHLSDSERGWMAFGEIDLSQAKLAGDEVDITVEIISRSNK